MISPMIHALAYAAPLGAAITVALWFLAERYASGAPILPARPKRATPRHRLTAAAAADPARRDWAALTAERLAAPRPKAPRPKRAEIAYDPLDHRIPLAEVERRMALAAADGPTLELVAAP